MRSRTALAGCLAAALCASGCGSAQHEAEKDSQPAVRTSEKPFASGGRIGMQLDGGSYEIRPAAGDRIAVRLTGNVGAAKADISVEGAQADVKVQDTPHNNFHATIEVPKTADLVVQLSGGNLDMAAIAGNKDIESTAGNVTILVGNPDDYASVDAAVKAGDLNAPAFGGAKSGLLQQFNWSGRGKYRLRVRLGAGNLELRI